MHDAEMSEPSFGRRILTVTAKTVESLGRCNGNPRCCKHLTISPIRIAGLDSAFPQAITHRVCTEPELLADLQWRKT